MAASEPRIHEQEVPPVGEEIHLPGPSIQPLLLTIGLTVALVGVTTNIVLVVLGGLLSIAVLIHWIKDATREYRELPLEHRH